MRIACTTLETTSGCGHGREGLRLRKLGASVRGSSAYAESGGASSGSCTSKNSPGQTVLEGAGAQRTKALRTVLGGLGGALTVKGVPASTSTSRSSTTSPSNVKSVLSRVKDVRISQTT